MLLPTICLVFVLLYKKKIKMNIKLLLLESPYYIVALRKEMADIAAVTKALAYLILSPLADSYLCDFSFAPRCVHFKSFDIGVQVKWTSK